MAAFVLNEPCPFLQVNRRNFTSEIHYRTWPFLHNLLFNLYLSEKFLVNMKFYDLAINIFSFGNVISNALLDAAMLFQMLLWLVAAGKIFSKIFK